MRAKGTNTMSTRRAVRPDAEVYRQTRRLGRRRRPASLTAAYICLAAIVLIGLISWWLARHH